ncbi:amidase [Amycolatopsis nalaikhensis]|uniref:Amidase n=1 Tax=Amycolatopsis nalaikhensis TaxID=715472 RepID=A0ABY8XEH0_9PSEU|nr:amidase [Amycolatopsis sp. 2-2]WIV54007.1 amidase [Amycolatopsis sp. 2-2]
MRSLVEAQLAVARDRNPELRALIRTLPPAAPAEGPLHGLTVSVKDNIDVAGVPTTAGSAHLGTEPAAVDAEVVRRLREAGAIITSKANLAEFAMGVVGRNAAFGDVRNARDPQRISGGSSSGSAVAVASGMSTAALGTDTGGSGRVPASVNGIVGLRPTLGRVSNEGVLPVGESFDTVTPLTRDVPTAAAMLAVLSSAGPPVDALPDPSVAALRFGVATGFFRARVDPGVRRVVDDVVAALRTAGAEILDVEVPGAAEAQDRMIEIMYPEAAAVHACRLREEPGTIDPDVLRRLRIGQSITPETAARAREWQREFRHRVDELFEDCDVVVMPTIPVDVPRRDAVDLAASTREIARFCYVWSCYGGPSISLPGGDHPGSGMPVGVQLSAAPWQENRLLRAAAGLEALV